MALAHFATLGAHWGLLPMTRLRTSRIVHHRSQRRGGPRIAPARRLRPHQRAVRDRL